MHNGYDQPAPGAPATPNGQVLVVFALSLITLLGFAGLALDGGSTFAQKRGQQTAADLAALGAANDYLINGNLSLAVTRARTVTQANGFTHASGGTTVSTALDTSNGIAFTVTIDSPHHNAMAGLMGMPTWMVTTTATALAGFPDTAYGASPFIFPVSAFAGDGTPLYQTPTNFGETNGDIPTTQLDFAWTNYGTGNLDTTKVDQMIKGELTIDKTIEFGEYIGQQNQGNHNYLYPDVNTYLAGTDVPAAIVDASGNFMGWATFHVISAEGGSAKHVYGYFQASYESARLSISACSANDCPRYLGTYILKLSN
jgi:Putative Flp pilus-assembly TadE/G-like